VKAKPVAKKPAPSKVNSTSNDEISEIEIPVVITEEIEIISPSDDQEQNPFSEQDPFSEQGTIQF
jgi:hypothetical protein